MTPHKYKELVILIRYRHIFDTSLILPFEDYIDACDKEPAIFNKLKTTKIFEKLEKDQQEFLALRYS